MALRSTFITTGMNATEKLLLFCKILKQIRLLQRKEGYCVGYDAFCKNRAIIVLTNKPHWSKMKGFDVCVNHLKDITMEEHIRAMKTIFAKHGWSFELL